jgi:hypothetical protein
MRNLSSMARVLGGYFISLYKLTETRLGLKKLTSSVDDLRRRRNTLGADSAQFEVLLVDVLKQIGERQRLVDFRPNAAMAALRERSVVLTNGSAADLDGGYNENLKSILKTSNISQLNRSDADLNIITVMRPEEETFWACISRSHFFGTPLYFFESAFFAGFSSYFDKDVPSAARKILGYIVDDMGIYFDARTPSRLESLLNDPGFKPTQQQLDSARLLIDKIVANRVTKYNKYVSTKFQDHQLGTNYVLVIDQKRNDASIRFCGADNTTFVKMLEAAVQENPDRAVYVKTHPDNQFVKGDCYQPGAGWTILDDHISIADAMENAVSVYTVSSQVGFEALLRGKHVAVFGLPFYSGWGLTDDRRRLPRRNNKRTLEELFHIACVEMSVYIDPATGKPTDLDSTIDRLLDMRAGRF